MTEPTTRGGEPRTEAGRALLSDLRKEGCAWDDFPDAILAIEAQAAEQADARLREALIEELYALGGDDGEVMVRIEEAVAAISSRWDIEHHVALTASREKREGGSE